MVMKKSVERLRLRSGVITHVSGYRFVLDDFPFMELFVHRPILRNGNFDESKWHVSELTTGMKCGFTLPNRKDAMISCERLLNSKGKAVIQKQIKDCLREYGGSLLNGETDD